MDRGNLKLRRLDENLGPLLLRALQAARKMWPRSKRPLVPHRIGVIKAAALGDTILVSAIISDLRKAFPSAQIFLFVGQTNAGLAKLLEGVDEVCVLPLRNPLKAMWILRSKKCDWMIDTDSWPRLSALWAAIAGAEWTIGFRTLGQRRDYAFDQVVSHDASAHELENLRNLLRALFVPARSEPQALPRLHVDSSALREFRMWKRDSLVVGFHLWPGGTRSDVKEWPAENWLQLAMLLAADSRWKFVLTGSAADRDKNEKVMRAWPEELRGRVYNAAGMKLEETLGLLRETVALVSVNTGILHLAAALGVPVLGLHGPTNPVRWGPVGEKHISVLSAHPRAGCLNLGFEYPEEAAAIMPALGVADVQDGWQKLVSKNQLNWQSGRESEGVKQ